MNELEAAQAVQSGLLQSPTRYGNMTLFALRVTGTGASYRSGAQEYVWRDPSLYLNDEFVARVAGLPVIWEHPDGSTLNSAEYAARSIGAAMFGYIKGDEVWCVARIYDDDAVTAMLAGQLSTSPTIVLGPEGNFATKLEDGSALLIEGAPPLLCHLAVVANGVWDKSGPPTGVLISPIGDTQMTDEEKDALAEAEATEAKGKAAAAEDNAKKADADADPMAKLMACMDAMSKRMDAWEADRKADAKKADKKADAGKDPIDAATPEQVAADKARKDAEEAEDKKKTDAAKADAQAKADADDVRRKIADLDARMPKQMSDADYTEMADAQAKADSVHSAHGSSAPRPLQGETLLAYRKRLATGLKTHSRDWKGVDMATIDATVLGIAEDRIYADAMEAALRPADLPEGQLREIKRRDATGRQISTFLGAPRAWMSDFRSPPRRLIGINKGV